MIIKIKINKFFNIKTDINHILNMKTININKKDLSQFSLETNHHQTKSTNLYK